MEVEIRGELDLEDELGSVGPEREPWRATVRFAGHGPHLPEGQLTLLTYSVSFQSSNPHSAVYAKPRIRYCT